MIEIRGLRTRGLMPVVTAKVPCNADEIYRSLRIQPASCLSPRARKRPSQHTGAPSPGSSRPQGVPEGGAVTLSQRATSKRAMWKWNISEFCSRAGTGPPGLFTVRAHRFRRLMVG